MSEEELKKELELERGRRIEAQNDAVLQSLQVELLKQDLGTIRRIIQKGGSAVDVLAFLDTPNSCLRGEINEEDADMIARISGAVISKDWRKFAELVVEAPDIEVIGKANIAIKLIAEAAIEKLGNSGQSRHLESIVDLAIISERNSRL
jgi:tagatose-1,6-bisphosphate aldolase